MLWWVSEILSMTYVVLKGYLYDPIWFDRLLKARGSNGTGESIQKDSSFLFYSILLAFSIILVSHLGSVSPFFRDELLALVLHFVSVDRGERWISGKRVVPWAKQGVNCFKYTTWILAMQWSWTLMSIRMNQSFHRGKSLPARQEGSKLQILSR